ncbi:NUDIX hydrolase [Occultella aeris]|uniref:ADP-ribose pyrophosphatase n=1 Tax=Occultella aeris TaxID=2761496 RepID=A0A7M4DR71_9MICO|nr:NUDIX hydrolase [Occultella aeris]VZO39965.1 ADP-ribose pyrophosphatase [Occultella aeris]
MPDGGPVPDAVPSVPDTAPIEGPIADERVDLRVTDARTIHAGYVFDIVAETVDLGAAGTVHREFMKHPGAVAVVALDDAERVLLLRQYRHPVRSYLWEVPAGLLDVADEPLVDAAARELAEEADLRAGRWDTLVDYYTSPGGSDEALRIFLARDLGEIPDGDRFTREGEEAGIQLRWVPLADAVAMVMAGDLHNPSAVAGLLALQAARATGLSGLRPADAPWVR